MKVNVIALAVATAEKIANVMTAKDATKNALAIMKNANVNAKKK